MGLKFKNLGGRDANGNPLIFLEMKHSAFECLNPDKHPDVATKLLDKLIQSFQEREWSDLVYDPYKNILTPIGVVR